MTESVAGPVPRAAAHVRELDGVRGVAILMVMALHFVCSQAKQPESRLEELAGRLTAYGAWGVDLFFVLSGFLITGILWDSRGNSHYFRTFYARRTLRIFPLYYAMLLIAVVILPLTPLALEVARVQAAQGWLWSYLTNVYVAREGGFTIPYVSHFWTLAIEEHFYLIWPFAVGLLSRKVSMALSLGASVMALGLRIGIGQAGLEPYYAHVLTPCRLDALCIGSWLALASRGPHGIAAVARHAKLGLALAALGILLASFWHVVWPASAAPLPLRETALAVFFGAGILLASWSDGPALLKRVLRWRWLGTLGKYSYGLYVFHGIIAYAFGTHGTLAWFSRLMGSQFLGLMLQAVVGSLGSLAVAVVSYELFELHFLRLKKHFEAAPSARPVAQGAE